MSKLVQKDTIEQEVNITFNPYRISADNIVFSYDEEEEKNVITIDDSSYSSAGTPIQYAISNNMVVIGTEEWEAYSSEDGIKYDSINEENRYVHVRYAKGIDDYGTVTSKQFETLNFVVEDISELAYVAEVGDYVNYTEGSITKWIVQSVEGDTVYLESEGTPSQTIELSGAEVEGYTEDVNGNKVWTIKEEINVGKKGEVKVASVNNVGMKLATLNGVRERNAQKQYCATLQEAIGLSVVNGEERPIKIKVLNNTVHDANVYGDVEIGENQIIQLDLGGSSKVTTILDGTLENRGKLTITGSGKLIQKNSLIDNVSNDHTITNYGIVNMNGNNETQNDAGGIIENHSPADNTYYAIWNGNDSNAITTVCGGTVYGIYNTKGEVKVVDGQVGVVEKDGNIVTGNENGIYNDEGTVKVIGGKVDGTDNGIYTEKGTVIITGGTVTGGETGIEIKDGELEIGKPGQEIDPLNPEPRVEGGKTGVDAQGTEGEEVKVTVGVKIDFGHESVENVV